MLKAIEDGIYTVTTKNRLSQLENELMQLSNKIRVEENRKLNIPSKKKIIGYIKSALESDGKALIRFLIDKVVLYDDKIVYKYSENKNPNKSDGQACWDFYLYPDVQIVLTALNFTVKMEYLEK